MLFSPLLVIPCLIGFVHPHMVTIVGSAANPASVTLQQTTAGTFLAFVGKGCDGLTFYGFRAVVLNSESTVVYASFTRLFFAGGGATPTLIFSGGYYCLLAQFHVTSMAGGAVQCTGNQFGFNIQFGSTMVCNSCRFTGTGVVGSFSAYSYINSYVHVGSSIITGGYTYGQLCSPFSLMVGSGTSYGGVAPANYYPGCTGQFV